MIRFDEESHTYTNDETGENYISVTTLLGKFKPKFNVEKYSNIVANREGMTQDDIKTYWKDLTNIATTKGKNVHSAVEDYINTGETNPDFKEAVDHVAALLNYNGSFEASAEQLLYNHFHKVAGMSDIVLENDKFFKIWDIKTNKKIRTTNEFYEDKFLLDPVSHLPNCEYSIYTLQLSLYAYLKEMLTGKKCLELMIFHITKQSNPLPFIQHGGKIVNSPPVTQIVNYPVSYMKEEILELLKYIC